MDLLHCLWGNDKNENPNEQHWRRIHTDNASKYHEKLKTSVLQLMRMQKNIAKKKIDESIIPM